jgi:hypothetical protein
MIRDGSGGPFALDFLAGYGIFMVLLALVFHISTSSLSGQITRSYAADLRPLAEQAGNLLTCSPGSPPDWHISPAIARGASILGLSDGRPCILSVEKVYSLGFFNESELCRRLGLDDAENSYGIRIEVSADDGSISVASGYIIDDGTLDVCKSVRLVAIRDANGDEKNGKLIVYIWREHVGSLASKR